MSFEQAESLLSTNPDQGIAALRSLISRNNLKDAELAILKLGEVFAQNHQTDQLSTLITDIRPLFSEFPKAKTAKIVRTLIETASLIPNSEEFQIRLCEESIAWCREEKRTFLRQRLETKLAMLYYDTFKYKNALDILEPLLKEVKKLDDKQQLVEVQLIESKVYQRLQNIPRAKASLTAARSCANAIYCPPFLQADIDMMSGILNCEERDYRTGYSYFFEAHEGFHSIADPRALYCLKYILLCKIMTQRPDEVSSLINTKGGTQYTGRDIDSMRAVAKALELRSLHQFQETLQEYYQELQEDIIVNRHIQALYDTMLESHLIRIIEPFSKVEIPHVAHLIDLPEEVVVAKLSQMILDKKFDGTLDQGSGCLIVFDETHTSELYDSTITMFGALNTVVGSLFEKALQAKETTSQQLIYTQMAEYEKALHNRYDPYTIKGKLDDYIENLFTRQHPFTHDWGLNNIKLAIGAIATLFCVYAHVHEYIFQNAAFPKNYWILVICAVFYFAFNLLYQYIDYWVEGDVFFTTVPTTVNMRNISRFSLESQIENFDDQYKLTLHVYTKKPMKIPEGGQQVKEGYWKITKNYYVGRFFDIEGYMQFEEVSEVVKDILKMLQGQQQQKPIQHLSIQLTILSKIMIPINTTFKPFPDL